MVRLTSSSFEFRTDFESRGNSGLALIGFSLPLYLCHQQFFKRDIGSLLQTSEEDKIRSSRVPGIFSPLSASRAQSVT